MDSTFERIDQLMREQKKQNKDLNNYLGVGKSTYDSWRNGTSKSYFRHIDQIAIFLGVSPTYLIMGTKNIDSDANDIVYIKEKELIELFRKLNQTKQELLLNVARNFYS